MQLTIMSEKIYLLTGAAGNLGSNISRNLIAAGENVRALVLNGDPAIVRVPKEAEICSGDVLDVSSLEKFFAVPEDKDIYVIHCASIVALDPYYSLKVHDVNITGTQNIIDQCVKHKVKKVVYISSTSAIPELPGDHQHNHQFRQRGNTRRCSWHLQLRGCSRSCIWCDLLL